MTTTRRRLLAGGVVGPAAFAAAWIWGSATTDGYSPVGDPISRLAALGAPSRPVMTAGLLVFAGGVGAYSIALRDELPGRAWIAAAVTAASTAGVAATPLDGPWGDGPHAVAAGSGYASLVVLQLLAAPRVDGRRRAAARLGAAVGAVSLLASSFGPEATTGLFQRLGLSAGHAWIAASALALASRGPDHRNPVA